MVALRAKLVIYWLNNILLSTLKSPPILTLDVVGAVAPKPILPVPSIEKSNPPFETVVVPVKEPLPV